ncbi:multicopper oxidase domain-containing protein [Methylobacter sp. G7]|uniref:multicopper oxidase domain-containing protein n=1 Tax=Methylobacter sp. G7 TaxID=3230117 RepID=UPI003D80212D
MNKSSRLLLLSIALDGLTTGCTDEAQTKAQLDKYAATQAEKAQHKPMSVEEMEGHSAGGMQHSMPVPADGQMQHIMSAEPAGTHQSGMDEIGRRADDLPAPLNRTQAQRVSVDLYTDEILAEIMPGVSYEYWTYNGKVPGPFIRVGAGDQVEIHLSRGKPNMAGAAPSEHASGHSAHSIDLHAVVGPGGGAPLMQVEQGEAKSFSFKATHPGIYVYHCASPSACAYPYRQRHVRHDISRTGTGPGKSRPRVLRDAGRFLHQRQLWRQRPASIQQGKDVSGKARIFSI